MPCKMMRAAAIFLFLAILASTTSAAPAQENSGGDRKWLIEGSCKLASIFDGRFTKDYCVSTLRGAPFEDEAKRSLRGLAWVSLSLLARNVSATKAKIEQMSTQGQFDSFVRDGLADCVSMYDEANDRAKEALRLFGEKNYKEADYTVSMVQGDGSECESWFTSQPGVKSPLTKENEDTQFLSSMATLIIRLFDKSYTPWGLPIVKNV